MATFVHVRVICCADHVRLACWIRVAVVWRLQVDRRGRDIARDYQIQRKIGSGNYSTVHRGVNLRTQEVVAIKVASKRTLTQEDIDAVYVEVDVLQEVRADGRCTRLRTWNAFSVALTPALLWPVVCAAGPPQRGEVEGVLRGRPQVLLGYGAADRRRAAG